MQPLTVLRAFLPLFLGLLALPVSAVSAATETGYMAIDVETGHILDSAHADDTFIPASVTKLPVALTVFDRLGPDHRYRTRLAYTGILKAGVLHGDLWLIGGGDPLLDHPALQDMAAALRAKGVERVEGGFFYDATALPHIPVINDRQPPDASYNPGIDGLSLDNNRFLVDWIKGRPVGAQIPLTPLPVAEPDPRAGRTWLPVRNPGLFAARAFVWAAAGARVSLPTPQEGHAPPLTIDLAVHDSRPVAEILRVTLFFSNNVAAEILALTATHTPNPAQAASAVMKDMRQRLPDFHDAGFALSNGSGLDDQARMTPRQCARVAREAARTEGFRPIIPPLLTDPFGVPDRRSPSPSPLRAKSGTLAYARALAGVVETRRHRQVAFCVMTDDKNRRAAYAALPFDRRDTEKGAYRAWRKQAKTAEETLVLGWRERF